MQCLYSHPYKYLVQWTNKFNFYFKVDDEGALKADQISTYIKENFAKESWIESALDKIVSNCVAEAKNATENPSKFYTAGLKACNPTGLSLKHCIFKEIQLSCPADQIKDKAACDKFQDRIKKGMDVYGPPPPPFDGPKDEQCYNFGIEVPNGSYLNLKQG